MEMDDRDSAKCQKSMLRDMMGIFGMFNEEKDKKPNSDLLLQMKLSTKTCSSWCGGQWLGFLFFYRERDHLISRFSVNRTVGSRRSKK